MEKKEMLAQQIFAAINENEEFCKAFVSAENAEAVKKVLAENGFELTLEDIEAIFADGLDEIKTQNDPAKAGELSEDQLDDVAGGGFFKGTLRLAVSCGVAFGYGCFCGICPAAAAGANYVAGGLGIWTAAGYVKKGW